MQRARSFKYGDDINTDFSISADFDFVKCRQSSKYRNSTAGKNSFVICYENQYCSSIKLDNGLKIL